MGEAKRRKLLDPNFGKVKRHREREWQVWDILLDRDSIQEAMKNDFDKSQPHSALERALFDLTGIAFFLAAFSQDITRAKDIKPEEFVFALPCCTRKNVEAKKFDAFAVQIDPSIICPNQGSSVYKPGEIEYRHDDSSLNRIVLAQHYSSHHPPDEISSSEKEIIRATLWKTLDFASCLGVKVSLLPIEY